MSGVPNLLMRAEGGPQIGLGHVMRCLALAQACVEAGGRARLMTQSLPVPVRRRFEMERVPVHLLQSEVPGSDHDAAETAALGKNESCSWIVVDGYCFGTKYQDLLKRSGAHLLLIDDNGNAGAYCADAILNQNIHAQDAMYTGRQPHAQLLLGPMYALLRREFRQWLHWERPEGLEASNVVVAMGGSDPSGLTHTAITALAALRHPDLKVRVAIGAQNRRVSEIRVEAARAGFAVEVDVPEISALMAWADVAIAAAGTTTWELGYMQLPSVLVAAAENQRPIAEELDRRGSAIYVNGPPAILAGELARAVASLLPDAGRRAAMARAGRDLVDGLGAERVIGVITDLRLRPAAVNDSRAIWEVANEASVRAVSFSSAPIEWETHEAWFRAKLQDHDCVLYVAEDGAGHLGQVRFEIASGEATLSVALRPERRGRGFGTWTLIAACKQFFSTHGVASVHAYIRSDNEASFRAFSKAGFREVGTTTVKEQPARHFVLDGR